MTKLMKRLFGVNENLRLENQRLKDDLLAVMSEYRAVCGELAAAERKIEKLEAELYK